MRDYLENMVEMVKKLKHNSKMKYSCMEEFVLKNGKEYHNGHPGKIERGKMKECFRNAFLLADMKNLIYVEGFATFSGIGLPVLHAWCVNKKGVVIDPTWDHGDEYWGVPFSMRYIRKILLKTKRYGIIDNWEMHFPLLTGEHTDFTVKNEN
jgi:hypothetical protein